MAQNICAREESIEPAVGGGKLKKKKKKKSPFKKKEEFVEPALQMKTGLFWHDHPRESLYCPPITI